MLLHQRDGFRVENRPVLDRRHARAHRGLDTRRSMRVRRDAPIELRGGLDDRPHFLFAVLLHAGRVRERQHTTRRADLDDVCAILDRVAYGVAHLVEPIGDTDLDTAFVS